MTFSANPSRMPSFGWSQNPTVGLRRLSVSQDPWNFPYRFLPFFQPGRCQNGCNGGTKKLKLRKTLHLADTIGGGKRIQENPPPGTSITLMD
jgi:hypothetical protein